MMSKNKIDISLNTISFIYSQYKSGTSITTLSREIGVSKGFLEKQLKKNGFILDNFKKVSRSHKTKRPKKEYTGSKMCYLCIRPNKSVIDNKLCSECYYDSEKPNFKP